MSCVEANRSSLDWITILNDISLQKQYADAWKQKQRKNPSFECVIRKGIHFPKDEIQGLPQNQQLEDESSDSKTKRIKMQVLSLLKLSSCELNDLLQFISVSDLVEFFEYFDSNAILMELSVSQQNDIKLTLQLLSLVMELQHTSSVRFCLQKRYSVIPTISIKSIVDDLEKAVQSWNHQDLSCLQHYACFLLGCYFYLSFNWNIAIKYWQLSSYSQYHWYEKEMDIILSILSQSTPLPTQPTPPQLDISSFQVLPISSSQPQSHQCILNLQRPPQQNPLSIISHHLSTWFNKSSYFTQMNEVSNDHTGLTCFINCFCYLNYTSEVLCLNQYLSCFNFNNLQSLLSQRDITVDIIPYLYSIPLLEFLIQYYSSKATFAQKYKIIFDALMKQMQNPSINMFNDSQILSVEIVNLEKRLFRYLYVKYVM